MRIFLTRHPSLLGLFVNNLALGRKYAKHEKVLYLVDNLSITVNYQQLIPMRLAFFLQKHCF